MNEHAILALPSMPELIIVLVVVLLLFGSAKLPKLARSLGSSVTEFKKGIKGGDQEEDDDKDGDDGKKLNVPKDEPAKSE